MRKLLAAAMLFSALSAQFGASAAEQGHILVGNPTLSVSEFTACEPGEPTDGLDGQWFAVTGGSSLAVTLADGATGAEDLDVYFYDASCEWIEDDSMASAEPSESGSAPANASFIVVVLFFGADATFTVSQG